MGDNEDFIRDMQEQLSREPDYDMIKLDNLKIRHEERACLFCTEKDATIDKITRERDAALAKVGEMRAMLIQFVCNRCVAKSLIACGECKINSALLEEGK